MSRKKWTVLENILIAIIFLLAIQYENAINIRLLILITTIILIFICNIIQYIFFKEQKHYIIIYLLKILFVFLLEYNSRYVTNYAFHVYYSIFLVDLAIFLTLKNYIWMGLVLTFVSIIKYINKLSLESNFSVFSEVIFFALINLLIYVVLGFVKYSINEKKKVEELYAELRVANDTLIDHSKNIEKLTLMQERTRVARDLHDSIGHKITGLIIQLEMTQYYHSIDINKSKELLDNAKLTARESLSELRHVVNAFKEDINNNEVEISINQLIDKFNKNVNINTHLIIQGEKRRIRPEVKFVIFRFVQEGLTNCAKHSQCTKIIVLIDYNDKGIKVSVSDNGEFDWEITEGNGIAGIRERVESINGSLIYRKTNGFEIIIFIPWEEII
ncbi:MAG: sensor histidine kinase [Eubacteriaceae bacterium]